MPNYDFRCETCGYEYEDFVVQPVPAGQAISCSRCLRWSAVVVWKRAPGMKPDPYWSGVFDPALGVTINSQAEKRAVLAERGLMEMPTREFTRRAEEAPVQPEPEFLKTEAERQEFRETAEKTWNDIKYGNVEVPQVKTVEEVIDAPGDGA